MKDTTASEGDLATPAEVAKHLRVTEQQLADMRYYGTGPEYIKIGRQVRYDWAAVRDYKTANTFRRTG